MDPGTFTRRFSNRVDDYVRYRPDYPPAMMTWLQHQLGPMAGWQVADIGAGTGISSKMLLDAGLKVAAVEPNTEMRAAAEQWLAGHAGYTSIDGRSDATGLAAASIDLISVAQAFHWFDLAATHREFARILKPGGMAAIYWNVRRLGGTPFLIGYEDLLERYGTDYLEVRNRHADEQVLEPWFGAGFRASASFEHRQRLDFDSLRGRLLSSSYAPLAGHPNHEPMLATLRGLFEACADDGKVSFDYDTRIYLGEVC